MYVARASCAMKSIEQHSLMAAAHCCPLPADLADVFQFCLHTFTYGHCIAAVIVESLLLFQGTFSEFPPHLPDPLPEKVYVVSVGVPCRLLMQY